jgi:pyruvate kinase
LEPSKATPNAGTLIPATRRAKIICTIGPACNSEEVMRDLLRLGMDVARLNFSHGSHQDHARNIERLRRAAVHEAAPSASCRICRDQKFAPARSSATSPFC